MKKIVLMFFTMTLFIGCSGDDKVHKMLSAPTGVSAVQSDSYIKISWNAVPGATYYVIYRSSDYIGEVWDGVEYYDKEPMEGRNYYTIQAVDDSYMYGYESSVFCDYTPLSDTGGGDDNGGGSGDNSITLPAPNGVSASQSGSSVSISWNAVSGASSYSVYRSSSADGTYSYIASVSKTSATDTSPLSGFNYYKIIASNAAGVHSDFSTYDFVYYTNDTGGGNGGNNDDEDDKITLPAPYSVSASQDGSSVSISWSYVSGASSYSVYRSSSANGYYSLLTTSVSTSATDTSPRSGYNYYKIIASKGTTTSEYSSYASVDYTSCSTYQNKYDDYKRSRASVQRSIDIIERGSSPSSALVGLKMLEIEWKYKMQEVEMDASFVRCTVY
jgi:fibronectin type 3 domain-containing protein